MTYAYVATGQLDKFSCYSPGRRHNPSAARVKMGVRVSFNCMTAEMTGWLAGWLVNAFSVTQIQIQLHVRQSPPHAGTFFDASVRLISNMGSFARSISNSNSCNNNIRGAPVWAWASSVILCSARAFVRIFCPRTRTLALARAADRQTDRSTWRSTHTFVRYGCSNNSQKGEISPHEFFSPISLFVGLVDYLEGCDCGSGYEE